MTTELTCVTRAPVRIEDLFAVSLDIDEHAHSMASSGEQAIAGVTSGQIDEGETVTWRARHFGVRFTMMTRVSDVRPPRSFHDEQVAGPFRSFHHEHRFFEEGAGTLMIDRITFESPIFGVAAERFFLRPYLRHLIRKRNRHLIAAIAQGFRA